MPDEENQMHYLEGLNRFQSARNQAFWQEMIGLLRGKPAELLSFDEIKTRLRLREESYRGLQDERWSRVYARANSLEGMPPIELYKVDDVYFVRDGNHRVSVARQMGQKTIQAHVTELPTHVDLEPGMSEKELDAAEAYAQFLHATRLAHTRPHHQSIKLSEPQRYVDLLGHIYLHQRALQVEGREDITLEEAAADWYDNVYRPALTLIRKYEVLKLFPKRTEGDLYLWLVDHLSEVKAELGEEARTRTFSQALTDLLAEKHKPIPEDLLKEKDDSVILTRSEIQAALDEYRAKVSGES
jgi:hypothetical protein